MRQNNQKRRNFPSFTHCFTVAAGVLLSCGSPTVMCRAFLTKASFSSRRRSFSNVAFHHNLNIVKGRRRAAEIPKLYIMPPPGSGYVTVEDEDDDFPDTYEPMMEYPGTMRPGRTPENMPFHDLPIGDDDPDPVPWPHFQQIEWHHQWEPPHPHPTPIEDYIEQIGRWATPEQEAAMRVGGRRAVKERREAAEAEKRSSVIMDDDEDEGPEDDVPVNIGDGVFGQLGSKVEEAATAAVVKPPVGGKKTTGEEEEGESDDFDDFLLDLGLDDAGVDDDDISEGPSASTRKKGKVDKGKAGDDVDDIDDDIDLNLDLGLLDDDVGDDDLPAPTAGDDDSPDIGLSLDDDEDVPDTTQGDTGDTDFGMDDGVEVTTDDEGVQMVPLEDFDDDDTDTLHDEDAFDDGGFDYDDGGGGDFEF